MRFVRGFRCKDLGAKFLAPRARGFRCKGPGAKFLAPSAAVSKHTRGVARIFLLNEICARISLQGSGCQVPSPARARISLQGSGCQVPSPARGGLAPGPLCRNLAPRSLQRNPRTNLIQQENPSNAPARPDAASRADLWLLGVEGPDPGQNHTLPFSLEVGERAYKVKIREPGGWGPFSTLPRRGLGTWHPDFGV